MKPKIVKEEKWEEEFYKEFGNLTIPATENYPPKDETFIIDFIRQLLIKEREAFALEYSKLLQKQRQEIKEWLIKELKGVDTIGKCHEEILFDFDKLKNG